MVNRLRDPFRWILPCMLPVCAGCHPRQTAEPLAVTRAWDTRTPDAAVSEGALGQPIEAQAIALIDGVPISRSRIVDLLLAGHGAEILEQVIVTDRAMFLAEQRGLRIAQADIDAEYDRSLRKLLDNETLSEPELLQRTAAEARLTQILTKRNISKDVYLLAMQRNACLRKIAAAELRIDDRQLQEEFARLFGERVEVRHIQLASRDQVEALQSELAAGTDFGALAIRHSANAQSAARGGLMPTFTAADPDLPKAFRDAAFSLAVGEVSGPVFADGWYHVIRVDRRTEFEKIPFEQVRVEVELSLRERLVGAAMQRLFATLLDEAEIEIMDPVLRKAFDNRRPKEVRRQ